MPSLRLRRNGIAWPLLCLVLVACATHGEVAAMPQELSAVAARGTAAVLIRFDGVDENGGPLRPFVGKLAPSYLAFSIGDSDSGGVPLKGVRPGYFSGMGVSQYHARFLSKESRDEGWIALFLPPGYYYLALTEIYYVGVPQWRLEVPSGIPAIYAGTFYLSGETSPDFWWGGRYVSALNQDATQIRDESDLAVKVARRDLSSLPPPVTRLVKRHSGPYLIGIPPAAAN